MAVANCTVVAGGGWNSVGAFPANQNDGDNGTYQWWPGNIGGSHDNLYDHTAIPDGAQISSVVVSGLWGAGSPSAVTAASVILGAQTLALGTIGDVASYGFAVPRPGGGDWTKSDIQTMRIRFSSLQSGNGNAMRLRSSVLQVTYILGGTYFVAMIH